MNRYYRVKWDFKKYQRRNWTPDFVQMFGERNEGARVYATDEADAIQHFARRHTLNGFYLTAELETA